MELLQENYTHTIERELFEAWLWAQDDKREFNYCDVSGECAICRFAAEAMGWKRVMGGGRMVFDRKNNYTAQVPAWFGCANTTPRGVAHAYMRSHCDPTHLSVADMKAQYLELFPPTPEKLPTPLPCAPEEAMVPV